MIRTVLGLGVQERVRDEGPTRLGSSNRVRRCAPRSLSVCESADL
jgi:hypothetical protein